MKSKMLLAFSLLIVFLQLVKCSQPVVKTSSGLVEGLQETVGRKIVNTFLGIPYAVPPVGDLRFKPTVQLPDSNEPIQAKKYSKSCIQAASMEFSGSFAHWIPKFEDTSEDCLYLNVWTQEPKPKNAAVMVWIHGGGYEFGTSYMDLYNGKYLAAEENVIVVTINYRLSTFGFLYLDEEDSPGNQGLMDQQTALIWVQKNIAEFGGDPKMVTIFGESAGAGSCGHHLNIPSSHGLFKRAILESGSSSAVWAATTSAKASLKAEHLSHLLGCSKDIVDRADILKCLRKKDVREIIQASTKIPKSDMVLFIPHPDGRFIPDEPNRIIQQRKFKADADIMIGETKEDGMLMAFMFRMLDVSENSFIDSKSLHAIIKTLTKSTDERIDQFVNFMYTTWEDPENPHNIRKQLSSFLTDLMFTCASIKTADSAATNGNNVYRYRFSHRPSNSSLPAWAGALHADEISFVFGFPTDIEKGLTFEEAGLSRAVMNLWASFARTGNPNNNKYGIQWPQYKAESRELLDIDLSFTTIKNWKLKECIFWNELYPKLLSLSDEPPTK